MRKVGRTTGYTEGSITGIDAAVFVNYAIAGYGNQTTVMTNQILTSPMAGYGDSGSLLVDGALNAVGMLSAGSSTATVFNYIEYIQNALAIRVADRLV